MRGLQTIMACSAQYPKVTAVVGTPAVVEGQMYNCAAVISGGVLRGLVTKTHLPNYGEFSERRWFSSSEDLQTRQVTLQDLGIEGEGDVPVGRDLLFKVGDGCILGVEICEDLWTPLPPSTLLTINGAEVVANLSASNEVAGKSKTRIKLVEHQSDVCSCVYAYCSSGCTESVQDLVFSGHSIIAETGNVLVENGGRLVEEEMLVVDADLGKVRAARRKNNLAGIMGRNGQRRFESKEACVEHLAELLGKYRAKGRVTLVQISRVYCASHQKWVRGVTAYMNHIRGGKWGQI